LTFRAQCVGLEHKGLNIRLFSDINIIIMFLAFCTYGRNNNNNI